ncbi:MAG: DUF2914 domain-containing protein [Bdellovibrionaceae bacterium]|nr:DUF2914 domain-containing protein [Bdellovibrio sp.]
MINIWKQQTVEFVKKHETRFEVGFFIAGFIFDALIVGDIDHLFSLIQQAAYLLVIATFIHYEILFRSLKWRPSGRFIVKVWEYRNLILHFFLGTLLNIYSIFYMKSSSFASSVVFLLLMIALVILNDRPMIKKSKMSVKVGLAGICLFSFISILFPLILGFVGWTPFGLSVITTAALFYLQTLLLKKHFPDDNTLMRAVFIPGMSVLGVFTLFYFLGWIPPVPLSVKEQGIYHLVEKREGQYFLSTENESWKFWNSGDQEFKARGEDKIYYYTQIYSPGRFSDQIFIQWLWKDPKKGWTKTDRIPLQIVGGRKEGFRGFAVKSNYQPGQWRVQVETSMGHEISRLGFEVIADQSSDPRPFRVLTK